MRKIATIFALSLSVILLISATAWGQIAAWNLTSTTTSATTTNANLTASSISVVPSSTISYQSSPGDIYNGTWSTSSTFSTSGKYWQFSIAANSGYQVSISSVTFGAGATSTGPQKLQVQYSLDGFGTAGTTALGESANTNTSTLTTFTLTSFPSATTSTITFRIWGYSASGTGNFRLNNVVINGTVTSTGGIPTKLAIPAINSGSSPSVNTPFDILVQSQDGSNVAQPVSGITGITLSLATGNGTLGGTLTGTISAGSNNVTISGVTYNTAESGVSITATRTSGDVLTAGTSSTFTVLDAASHLTLVNVPSGGQPAVSLSSFTVEARRGDNSVDLNYTGSITIGKTSGSGNISGTLTRSAAAGVATFNDIQFDASGSYTISASATGPTGTTSGTISILSSALPFLENFDYTAATTLVFNGWSTHSGAGTNSVSVTSSGLSYSVYTSSAVGNAAQLGNAGGEDVNRPINPVNTNGDVLYLSFLVDVNEPSSSKTGDYFIHLGNRTSATTFTSFAARVFARVVSGNVNFGLNNLGNPAYGSTNFSKNDTLLLIVKYSINTGGNDSTSLWVLTGGVPATEAAAGVPEVVCDSTAGQDIINAVGLRQGNANQPSIIVDGIRIARTWTEAAYPVELNTFTAVVRNSKIELNWSTATEVSNTGFEVQRKAVINHQSTINNQQAAGSGWTKIGFVDGAGTSNVPKKYNFTDVVTAAGKYSYRLKQIDRDGTFKYSDQIEASAIFSAEDYKLTQNYPNPFNPATTIRFAVKSPQRVTLNVYNALGQEVKTLFNQDAVADTYYNVSFDATGLASGVYYYRLRTADRVEMKKMVMLK